MTPPQKRSAITALERNGQSASSESEDAAAALAPIHREALAAEILHELEERGLPSGAWLVDIGRVRQALHDADDLLRRLEQAIIRSASSSPSER